MRQHEAAINWGRGRRWGWSFRRCGRNNLDRIASPPHGPYIDNQVDLSNNLVRNVDLASGNHHRGGGASGPLPAPGITCCAAQFEPSNDE